jgi:hypothetical protein
LTQSHPGRSDDDDALVDELRRVVGIADPIPERVLESARASFSWRTIDAELAELSHDSMLDAHAAALVRSSDAARTLTFDAPGLSVEVEVTTTGAERRLLGQLVPPQTASIEVRHPGGTTAVDADELGRFAVDGVAAGPVSLVCRPADARAVATEWLVV